MGSIEKVRQLLDDIAKSFRKYKQLKQISKLISLDVKVGDEKTITIGELQADPKETSKREDWENNSEIKDLAFKLLDKHEIDRKLLLFLYGLEMKQKEETEIEVDLPQDRISKNVTILLGKLAKELHAIDPHKPAQQKPTHDLVKCYLDYLKSICKYYYPELLSRILTEIVESASSDSNIERLFIDRLETQWQFKFKPDGVGLSKAAEFVQWRTNKP